MTFTRVMGSLPRGPIFSILLLLSSTGFTNGQGCNVTYGLGLVNNQIRDDQILCSGSAPCKDIRPKSAIGWYALNSNGADYVSVDLGVVRRVTHLEIYRAGVGRHITAFRLFHSLDGWAWESYQPIDNVLFNSRVQHIERFAFDAEETVMFPLENPNMIDSWIDTRFIAINPTNWTDTSPFLKMEIHGCFLDTPITPTKTDVLGGPIESDTTWTASNSPYVVYDTVIIPEGVTLTVEAGVRIVMPVQLSTIEVKGSMIARGTSANRILISAQKLLFVPIATKWYGLRVAESGSLSLHKTDVIQALICIRGSAQNIQVNDAVFSNCSSGVVFDSGTIDDSFVSLNGTFITHGISGISMFANPDRQIVAIEHTTITDQSRFGIRAQTDNLILKADGLTLSRSERYGLHVSSTANSRIYLANSQILDNAASGVLIDSGRKPGSVYLSVTNSTFQRNFFGISVSIYQQSNNGDWLISGNTFKENEHAGIKLELYGRTTNSETLTIQNNDFSSNGVNTDTCALCFNAFYQVVGTYIIDNNRLEKNGRGLSVRATIDLPTLNITVTNNRISQTTGSLAVDLELGKIGFVNNIITESAKKAVRLSRLIPDKFYYNVFNNPLSPFEVEIESKLQGNKAINLTHNYWGSADATFVISRVPGFYQNMKAALVDIFPFYTSSDFTQLYDGQVSFDFSQSDPAAVGGKLNASVTIERGSRLIITKTIWVPLDITLTIEPDVHLAFMSGRGIFVEGNLIAEGDITGLIQMTGYDTNTWSGIQLKETGVSLKAVQLKNASTFIKLKADHKNVDVTLENVKVIGGFIVLDATFDSASSFFLKDCDFTELNSGIMLEIVGGGSCNLTIDSTVISKISKNAVEIRATLGGFNNRTVNIHFKESKFIDTDRALFLNDQLKVLQVSAEITLCEFMSSKVAGLQISAWINYLLIENSKFLANKAPVLLFLTDCTKGALIKNNDFSTSLTTDIDINTKTDDGRPFAGSIKIVGNSINRLDSVQQSGVILNTDRFSEAHISENIFSRGRLFALQVGIFGELTLLNINGNFFADLFNALELYSEQNTDFKASIYKNDFRRNSGDSIVVVDVETPPTTLIDLLENSFVNNPNNNTIIKLSTIAVKIERNTFSNPESQYNVKFDKLGHAFYPIQFRQNDWGTTDLETIGNQLFDNKDSPNLPVFNLEPATPSSSLGSELNDNIEDSVVLSADRSPYTVASSIEITPTGVMKIEEGVVILFAPGVGLTVKGQLVVSGTVNKPVQFLPATPDMRWSGVDFLQTSDRPISKIHNLIVNNTSEGVEVRTTNIQLENVTSDFAEYDGFTFKFRSNEGALVIGGLKARNNGFSGVYDTRVYEPSSGDGSLQLVNCELQHNEDSGFYVIGSANVKLSQCVISNSKYGVFVRDRPFGRLEITSSDIYNNSQNAIKVEKTNGVNLAEYIMQKNTIRDHQTFSGGRALSVVHIEVNRLTENVWRLLDNTFENNNFNDYLIDVITKDSGPLQLSISQNNFIDNSSPVLRCSLAYNSPSEVDFERNTVERSSAGVSILYLDGSDRPKNTIKVKSNRFLDNFGADVIWYRIKRGASTMELSNNIFVNNSALYTVNIGYPDVNLDDNVFSNPLARCELKLPAFNPDWYISAKRSYWGFTDIFNIIDRICSFDKDMSLGRVDYYPFRLSEDPSNLIGGDIAEFSLDGAFGGVVRGQTVMNSSQSYTIWRSIFVEDGAFLTVNNGAQLQFAPNRGICAKGQLNIGQKQGEKVKLSAMENEWEGITFPWSNSRDRVDNIRLKDGRHPWSGRIEYLIDGEYGTVCSVNFDENDAMVACRELGYTKIDFVDFYNSGKGGTKALYGLQCTGSERSLLDCAKIPGTISQCTNSDDIGIACFGSRELPERTEGSTIYNAIVDGSKFGIKIHSLNVALAVVEINNTKESGITLDAPYRLFDMGGTVIRNSGKYGIHVLTDTSIGISNCVLIENAEEGVFFRSAMGEILVSNITALSNAKAGVFVDFPRNDYSLPQSVFIEDSVFENHKNDHALQVKTVSGVGPSTVTVRNNRFVNNSFGDLDVLTQSQPDIGDDIGLKTLIIRGNHFIGGGSNSVWLFDGVNLNVFNNEFKDGKPDTGCLLVIRTGLNTRRDPVLISKNVEVSQNLFESINGVCVVELKSSNSDSFDGLFFQNQITNSVSSIASVILASPVYTLTNNTFLNPQTDIEVKVEAIRGSTLINNGMIRSSSNKWGTTDLGEIQRRIHDGNDDSSLYLLQLDLPDTTTSRQTSKDTTPTTTDSTVATTSTVKTSMSTTTSSPATTPKSTPSSTVEASTPSTPKSTTASTVPINDNIVDSVVLSADRSPYTVASSIEITPSGVMTIEEGVVILFAPGVGLTVKGQLVVSGTVNNPVQFHPATPDMRWSGIDFLQATDRPISKIHNLIVNNTREGVEVQTTNIQLENVTSDFSEYDGFTFKFESNEGALVIGGLKARNNGFSGVYDTRTSGDGSLQLVNCELQHNEDSGFAVLGSADVKLSQCVISNSKYGVLVTDRRFGSLEITSSDIYNNSQNAIKVQKTNGVNLAEYILQNNTIRDHQTFSGGRALSVFRIEVNRFSDNVWRLLDNKFENNNFNDYLIDVITKDSGPLQLSISQNTFTDNASPVLRCILAYNSPSEVEFERNTVERSSAGVSILYLEGSLRPKNTIKVKSNRFLNNFGADVIWYRIKRGASSMELSNNIFVNNSALYTVNIGYPDVNLDENVFSNPLARCELKLPAFNPDWYISAKRSYWGFTDIFNIIDRICSFDKDMSLGRVDYYPFRLSEDPSNLIGGDIAEFSLDGAYGGVVRGQTVMNSSQSYTIWRSIFVEDGAFLTVNNGAQLQFAPNRGICAKGQLNIGQKQGEKVKLSAMENKWEGITFPWSESRDRVDNIRLKDGRHPWSGRIEYLIDGEYGTVCNVSFDENDAMVACRELGYTKIDFVDFFKAGKGGTKALYGLQCTGSERSLLDCAKIPGTESQCTNSDDIGIACFGSRELQGRTEGSTIYNAIVDGSKFGIKIHSLNVELADVEVKNTKESGIILDAPYRLFDLDGTVIRNSGKYGIHVLTDTSIGISNCVLIDNAEEGVFFRSTMGEILVSNITALSNAKAGVFVDFPRNDYSVPQSVIIEDSVFENHKNDHALQVKTVSGVGPSTVTIRNNRFVNNSFGDLDVLTQSQPDIGDDIGLKTLIISGNHFIGGGSNSVWLFDGVNLNVFNNEFKDGKPDTGCLLVIRTGLNTRRDPVLISKNVEVSQNLFESINGVCVVELKSSNGDSFDGLFFQNQITNSVSSIASVILASPIYTLTNNTFLNPQTDIEIKVEAIRGSTLINNGMIRSSSNKWGTTDLGEIRRRIHDGNDDSSLYLLQDSVVVSADRSPYTVASSIEITPSGVMKIEEGVVILFAPGVGLTVKGQLVVSGTVNNPVQFLPTTPDMRWSGVDFLQATDRPISKIHNLIVNNTSEGVEVRTTNIQLENVTSDFSEYDGFTFKFESSEVALVIGGLKARNNGFSGVYDTRTSGDESLQLVNCELQHNEDSGFAVRGSANVKLSQCDISNSKYGVLVTDRQFGRLEITSSDIYNNSQNAIKVEKTNGANLAEYILQNNTIRDHQTFNGGRALSVVHIEVNRLTENVWRLLDNTFENNNFNDYLIDVITKDSGLLQLSISQNTFTDNASPVLRCILAYNSPSEVDFDRNTVERSSAGVSIMYLDGSWGPNNTIKVKSNRFLDNFGADVIWYRIKRGASSMELSNNIFVNNSVLYTVNIGNPDVNLDDNVFSNPLARCELKLPAFNPDWYISAKRSYWGFTDIFNIIDRICSFDKDMSLGRVDYYPFRLSEDPSNLIGGDIAEFSLDGAYGGVVRGQTVMNSSQSYTIWRSIFVEDGAFLTVYNGAQLQFAPNRGICAKGQLNIGQKQGEKVILSAMGDEWEGITFPWSESRDRVDNIRLKDGRHPWSGRIEYLIDGEYGTVCNVSFDENDAMVACRELGYTKIDFVDFYKAGKGGAKVLYGLQCTGSERSLLDCAKVPGTVFQCSNSDDIGIACFGSRELPERTEGSTIYNAIVDGSKFGIKIHSLNVALADVEVNNTKESGITLDAPYRLFDLGGTVIRNSGKYGIHVLTDTSIGISNCVLIENAEEGVFFRSAMGEILVSNITALSNAKAGVFVDFPRNDYSLPQSVFIEDSVFENHKNDHALQVKTVSGVGPSTVTVRNNRFVNNSFGDLDVLTQSQPDIGDDIGLKTLIISGNHFIGGGSNSVWLFDGVNLNVFNNEFKDGKPDTGCLLVIRTGLNTRRDPVLISKNVEVSQNVFESINGVCVVELKSSNSDSFDGLFFQNQIANSVSSIASVILASPVYTLTNNSFINPQTDIEVKVEAIRGSTLINNGMIRSSSNKWGTTDLGEIQRRIHDGNDDSSLYLLQLDLPDTTTSRQTSTATTPTSTNPTTEASSQISGGQTFCPMCISVLLSGFLTCINYVQM